MIVPKKHIESLAHCEPSDQALLGKILAMAPRLAREQGSTDGFRVIINTGRVGRQEVYHLHVHVIGGPGPLGSRVESKCKGEARGTGGFCAGRWGVWSFFSVF